MREETLREEHEKRVENEHFTCGVFLNATYGQHKSGDVELRFYHKNQLAI